jgi:hypothetical protein
MIHKARRTRTMDITVREIRVLKIAAMSMLRRMEFGLAEPDPEWTAEDIRDIQYDMVVLTAALNRLEAEEKVAQP